ncbi:MAG: ACT domain-containing protein [Ruminococcaceae bacterium]|nr:ACT domain-containing protein [Oscillospiraceae bacterium]
MKKLDIKPISGDFSICKLADLSAVSLCDEFVFLSKTDEEISLVCLSSSVPENVAENNPGWCGFRICGILDFSLTGILSDISRVLADGGVGIFAVSTYNTDYVFVKKENFKKALDLLSRADYNIV